LITSSPDPLPPRFNTPGQKPLPSLFPNLASRSTSNSLQPLTSKFLESPKEPFLPPFPFSQIRSSYILIIILQQLHFVRGKAGIPINLPKTQSPHHLHPPQKQIKHPNNQPTCATAALILRRVPNACDETNHLFSLPYTRPLSPINLHHHSHVDNQPKATKRTNICSILVPLPSNHRTNKQSADTRTTPP